MATWDSLAVALYAGTALLLAAVAARAWQHTRSPKVLLLAAAFALFLCKGLLFTFGLFQSPTWREQLTMPGLGLDAAALGLLYGAVLRRS